MLLLFRWFFSILIYGRAPLEETPIPCDVVPKHIHTFSKWNFKESCVYHDECGECGGEHNYEGRVIYIRICSDCGSYDLKQYGTSEYSNKKDAQDALNKLIKVVNNTFEIKDGVEKLISDETVNENT